MFKSGAEGMKNQNVQVICSNTTGKRLVRNSLVDMICEVFPRIAFGLVETGPGPAFQIATGADEYIYSTKGKLPALPEFAAGSGSANRYHSNRVASAAAVRLSGANAHAGQIRMGAGVVVSAVVVVAGVVVVVAAGVVVVAAGVALLVMDHEAVKPA